MLNPNRPWPNPNKAWLMRQDWMQAFFLNTPIDPKALAPQLPAGLEIDLYDNQAWVSVIPFKMQKVGFSFFPWFQFNEFPEVNIRTYVKHNNKPGVLFISLDTPHRIFNTLVRLTCNIPYVNSNLKYQANEATAQIHLQREGFKLDLDIGFSKDQFIPPAGSFEYWIAERYCFYNNYRGKLTRWEVDHAPWPLHKATVNHLDIMYNKLDLNSQSLSLNCHYSPGVSTRAWWP